MSEVSSSQVSASSRGQGLTLLGMPGVPRGWVEQLRLVTGRLSWRLTGSRGRDLRGH